MTRRSVIHSTLHSDTVEPCADACMRIEDVDVVLLDLTLPDASGNLSSEFSHIQADGAVAL